MKISAVLLIAGALIAHSRSHAQNAVSVDFNGDCACDVLDALAFFNAFSLATVQADLTGDGLVSGEDMIAFFNAWQRDPGPFTVHWCVTTQYGEMPRGFGYRMDNSLGEDPDHPDLDLTNLPVVQDAAILHDKSCGEFPEEGLHMIFLRHGDAHLWSESYDEWRAAHRDAIMVQVPAMLMSKDPPYTYAVIDYESWLPRWVDMRANENNPDLLAKTEAWIGLVDAINTPVWDEEFFAGTGYSPPADSDGIGELSEEEREPAYQKSYDRFFRRFYLHTLDTAKIADDAVGVDVKWGFWRFPIVPHDGVLGDEDRQRNDELSWLYTQVDVFAPNFYRKRFTTDNPNDPASCDATKNRSSQKQASVWSAGMNEVHRLRAAYQPEAEIIPFIWWHYAKPAGQCYLSLLNDTDLQESLRVPRRWGADGLFIWGYTCPRGDDYDIGEPLPRERLQDELEQRWADPLRGLDCGG